MPEGDTVWRTAQRLNAALAGEPILAAELRWPRIPDVDLSGRHTLEVISRGKHVVHRIEGGLTLHSHLRMDGQWRVAASGAPTARLSRRSDVRALIETATWSALGLRLGMLDLLPTAQESTVVGHLGPDILGPDWDQGQVCTSILNDPRTIAESLLDQRNVTGIGTFWGSEGLFVTGIHPWVPARELAPERLEKVITLIQRLMRAACTDGVQASTGIRRRGQEAYVHARSGQPCRRCGDTVRVAMNGVAPQDRTIFYCPTCQGGLAPTDDGRKQQPLGSSRSTSSRPATYRPRR